MKKDENRHDEPNNEKENKKNLFSQLGRLFNSIAEIIRTEVKREEIVPLQSTHIISVHKRINILLNDAKVVLDNLKLFKEQLIKEFGNSSHSFINKSIDPIIEHACLLLKELSIKRDEEHILSDVYEKAIQSVELYAQFSDEKKLRRKIINEALYAIREAIEKDCQILLHYQHQAIQALEQSDEQVFQELDQQLEPLFNQFRELALNKSIDDDLRQFFIWKSAVDDRRNALVEEGLMLIDGCLSKKNILLQDEEAMELYSLAINKFSDVGLLEQQALKLLHLLETTSEFTPIHFLEFDQLIADLKTKVDDLVDETNQYSKTSESNMGYDFEPLRTHILRAETLLKEKQKQLREEDFE